MNLRVMLRPLMLSILALPASAQTWELGVGLGTARPLTGNRFERTPERIAETRFQGPWVPLSVQGGWKLGGWSWHREEIQLWATGAAATTLGRNDFYWSRQLNLGGVNDTLDLTRGSLSEISTQLGLRLDVPLGSLGPYGQGGLNMGLVWRNTAVKVQGERAHRDFYNYFMGKSYRSTERKADPVFTLGLSSRQERATTHLVQRIQFQLPLGHRGSENPAGMPELNAFRSWAGLRVEFGVQFK